MILVIVPVAIRVKIRARLSTAIAVGVARVCGLAAEVLLALCRVVSCWPHGGLSAAFLGHLHLGLVALVVLGAHGGQEVDEEAEDVPRVDECDDPFEYSGYVVVVVQLGDAEDDTKANF